MAGCNNCHKQGAYGKALKHSFNIEVKERRKLKIELILKGVFWGSHSIPIITPGLCKQCMAIVFKETARVLEKMSDEDFKRM